MARGDHPFPTPHNLEATGVVERWVARGRDPCWPASPAGVPLLVHPRPPWTLEMKTAVTTSLWRRGAAIRDLNALRARLSEVKCGGLRALAGRWPVVTAVWSDVAPRQGRYVSSGPTLVSTLARAADEVVFRYGLSANPTASVPARSWQECGRPSLRALRRSGPSARLCRLASGSGHRR